MNNNRPRILVVGSIVMDMIVTAPKFSQAGETVFGTAFSTAPGGKGANQALQAARLGADVTMVGMVGNDSFGREIISSLKDGGVNTDNIFTTEKAPTAIGNVQIQKTATSTENRITVIPGANAELTANDVEFLRDSIGNYDIVILQNEIPMAVNCAVAAIAKDAGVPIMLNPAPYSKLPRELIEMVTYITPNEHEAKDMTGVEIKTSADVEKALDVLCSMGATSPLITLGSQGCAYRIGGKTLFAPCANAGEVIDPTAAGDSFVGAFCTAVCAGADPMATLEFANHTAAITVCGMGAQPSLPTLEKVVALMERDGLSTEAYRSLGGAATAEKGETDVLDSFIKICTEQFGAFTEKIDRESLRNAANIILEAKNAGCRLHVTGIGKPSHVAKYAASLLSSTGTPTYYLHGTEAVHGSCGQLCHGDVVICISNSGETSELKATAQAIRNNGCKIISVTANESSWLGRFGDACLVAGVGHEGGVLNRAPRASILAETFILQCLSVLLQEKSDLTPEKYITFHPGGTLGQLRDNEK